MADFERTPEVTGIDRQDRSESEAPANLGDTERVAIAAALDVAIGEALARVSRFRGTDAGEAMTTVLHTAVMEAVDGKVPTLRALPAVGDAEQVLRATRGQLTRESRATGGLAPWQSLQLINAISLVESQLATGEAGDRDEPTANDGLGPVVEVAHDLRSPLAAVLFLVDMIRTGRSGPVSAMQQQQLRIIHSSILGLNHIACDLIDFVRGVPRLAQDGTRVFSIVALLQSVVDIVQPMAEEMGVTLELMTPAVDARIGQPALISRVVLNLTVNAVQHAERGVIVISAHPTDPTRLVFVVRDDGRFIPDDVVPVLFEAFRPTRQGHTRVFSSSGLGLAVCHRVLSSMDSELRVESGPDVGTRFSFVLEVPPA